MSAMDDIRRALLEMRQLPELPTALAVHPDTVRLMFFELRTPPTEELRYSGFKIVRDETVPRGQFRWVYGR